MTPQAADMRRWQDWATFALGLWLAVSPWLADYAAHDVATANAAVCGLALAVAAHFGFSCDHASCEWLDLAGGLWLVAAPFALASSRITSPRSTPLRWAFSSHFSPRGRSSSIASWASSGIG